MAFEHLLIEIGSGRFLPSPRHLYSKKAPGSMENASLAAFDDATSATASSRAPIPE